MNLDLSKEQANKLWVIINNDYQAKLKRWVDSFQDEISRSKVVESIKSVDETFISIDKDSSVCESLTFLIEKAKKSGKYENIIFTKWWDRFADEIPEAKICKKYWVEIVDWLWAKTHSSSDLVNKAANKDDINAIKETREAGIIGYLIPETNANDFLNICSSWKSINSKTLQIP